MWRRWFYLVTNSSKNAPGHLVYVIKALHHHWSHFTDTDKMNTDKLQDPDLVLNFSLLVDFELEEPGKYSGSSEELSESSINLLDSIIQSDWQENDSQLQGIWGQQSETVFPSCDIQRLDDVASKANTIPTDWQTNWAANALWGSIFLFESVFFNITEWLFQKIIYTDSANANKTWP